jgi:DNA replication protein DnaC
MIDKNVLYRLACVPERHSKDNFNPALSTNSLWNDSYGGIKARIGEGAIVSVVGGRGTGKTQLGACLIGHCCFNLSKSALYVKSLEIFLEIRKSMKTKDESEIDAIEKFTKPFLLVIDAYEVRSDSEFENRILNHIIDKRYDSMKSTIIISNDTKEEFSRQIGPSIRSRMEEDGGILELKNESFRVKK